MNTMKYKRINPLLALILVISLALTACKGSVVSGVEATASPAPTDTPVPTATYTATPEPTVTPTATATRTPTATPDIKATRAARQTATQEAINAMIDPELEKIGVNPSEGQVVWTMEDGPIELDGGGYSQGYFIEIEELGVLTDFVMQSEITWDTSGGLSGCGYIFRGPEDWDVSTSDFYILEMNRIQYAPTWWVHYYKDGRWFYSLPSGDGVVSPNLEDGKMSKNIVTLQVQGNTFTVYINGVKERSVTNDKVPEGRIAFMVVQNSGTSYCLFDKAWVWEFK